MNIRDKVGTRIKQARLTAGIKTGIELAKAAGLNHKLLYLYESGDRFPKPDVIKAIAKVTKADAAWLMGLTDDNPLKKEAPEYCIPQNLDSIALKSDFVGTFNLDKNKLSLIKVKGDAMAPTLRDGDLVLIDLRETSVSDGIFAIQSEDEVVIRRLQKNLDGTGTAIPDNKGYPEQTLSKQALNKLKVVGKLVWYGRKL